MSRLSRKLAHAQKIFRRIFVAALFRIANPKRH